MRISEMLGEKYKQWKLSTYYSDIYLEKLNFDEMMSKLKMRVEEIAEEYFNCE
jgi:hypothetical protein